MDDICAAVDKVSPSTAALTEMVATKAFVTRLRGQFRYAGVATDLTFETTGGDGYGYKYADGYDDKFIHPVFGHGNGACEYDCHCGKEGILGCATGAELPTWRALAGVLGLTLLALGLRRRPRSLGARSA